MQRPILGSHTRPASLVSIVSMCRHHARTLRAICRDLHKPPEFVLPALREAQAAGLVELTAEGWRAI